MRRPAFAPGVAEFTDPYLDPQEGILRNLTSARMVLRVYVNSNDYR
ncbi:hypothetical protein Lxx13800 [Leifsonia xyli subsp. xyli str. CTCB07]|uniref:Uncharacterized protein n=1 Tax=Leifsonia xyli subsp. xyli (strain CTCB07) TaxID=281090 RepID=Q6AEJ2_LEIXX|nr:hypothetical protein [Leifsonia xyli]AAT89204.1 hypothetical protein Lxx13800 [Leifsonia xyli subsp. xyli str. CTCB07]